MNYTMASMDEIIRDLQNGKMVIVVDDPGRENEGDLIMAAQFADTAGINFMTKYGRGLICTPMLREDLHRLQIPPMVAENTDNHQTAFTVSVDHISTTTGISPAERAATIRHLLEPQAHAADFRRPGHVFPLVYRDGGVLVRRGHTEASIDLLRIAGLQPAAVICEVTADNGEMMRLPELIEFARTHDLHIISVEDIIAHRKQHEPLVQCVASSLLPTQYGYFTLHVYEDVLDSFNHLAIVKGDVRNRDNVLVRIHSECLTGDVFGSKRCDCGEQLHAALQRIEKEGEGAIIYMRQEGRGIGLVNKIKAYHLQEEGMDTVEANEQLGFAPDLREYSLSAKIIEDLGIRSIRLLTNNPDKIEGLQEYGIKIETREPITVPANEYNKDYLHTKELKMGHQF